MNLQPPLHFTRLARAHMTELGWSEEDVAYVITCADEAHVAPSTTSRDVVHAWSTDKHVIYNSAERVVIDVKRRGYRRPQQPQHQQVNAVSTLPPRVWTRYESELADLARIRDGEVLSYAVNDRHEAMNLSCRMRQRAARCGLKLRHRYQNGVLYLST